MEMLKKITKPFSKMALKIKKINEDRRYKNRNKIKESTSRKVFVVLDYIFLTILALICFIPFLHILALSFSDNTAIMSRSVFLIPKNFTLQAYKFLGAKPEFFRAFGISVARVITGTVLQMFITFITAYPLSKESKIFRQRTFFVWVFVITMFIGGGLMSTYYVYWKLKLIDSFLVFILPGAFSVGNTIMLLNFFRGIPKDLEEAALLDGATQFGILFRIYLPLSLPSIATLTLFTAVGHWNSWFDGIIYMNDMTKYPLQSYLYTQITSTDALKNNPNLTPDQIQALNQLNNQNLQAAQIFLGILPILIVYPFVQRYFVKGITLGSVKG